MVFYFTSAGGAPAGWAMRSHVSAVVSPPAFLYMGRDKFENENLIKFGWPEDVWFVSARSLLL